VGRYIRWQVILTLTGIAMTMAFLSFLSLSRTTVIIPDVGGVYTEGIVGQPQFINPLLAQYNQVDQNLSDLIFSGLTRMNGEGDLEPNLAAGWQVGDNGLTYEFKLKRNIRWQDGRRFTASDVLFTIGLMQDPEFPGAPYLNQLWQSVTIEKLDEYTIRFVLSEPFPAFAEFTTIGLLPEHLLHELPARDLLNHPFNLQPIGTGPFKLDEVNVQIARLSVNPFYTGSKSHLDGLELRFFASHQDIINAYEAGEVQGISAIPPHILPAVQHLESLNLYTARLSGYNIIYLNLHAPHSAPVFQEVEVRQALLYGLNRQAIIDDALAGQGLVANSPILPWSWAYNPEQPTITFDPVQATNLLKASGWIDTDGDGIRDKEGRPLAFSLLTSDDPTKIKVAEVIRDQWQQIGLLATIEVVEVGLSERLTQHDFQAALAEVLLAGDPDPYPFWHQTQIVGGQNYAGWDHTKASMLLETARTITGKGRRNDYYFEFQQIFAEEVPSLILFHPVYTYGVSQEVFEVQLAPMTNSGDRFITAGDWYMLTRQVIQTDAYLQQINP
jgi:peptide/nickel transport system substrate-binding protein